MIRSIDDEELKRVRQMLANTREDCRVDVELSDKHNRLLGGVRLALDMIDEILKTEDGE